MTHRGNVESANPSKESDEQSEDIRSRVEIDVSSQTPALPTGAIPVISGQVGPQLVS